MLNTKHEKLEELTHIRSCSKCNIIYNIRNLNEDGLSDMNRTRVWEGIMLKDEDVEEANNLNIIEEDIKDD